jgi:hypothetical protein
MQAAPLSNTSSPTASRWTPPPRQKAAEGEMRRVGVEIEFNDLSVEDAASEIAALFGGDIRRGEGNDCAVENTALGDFAVEIDVKFAHVSYEDPGRERMRDAAARLSARVLPIEIVCPPVAWDRAHALDALCLRLAQAGAQGTRASVFYALGVQLNPELPSLALEDWLRTFRAYLLLEDSLRSEIGVDASRRLWRFEARFPRRYRDLVLDAGYEPGLADFIDDYLHWNPTRNRGLDLLPLLAHLDGERVRAALPGETIKPRPTWHYRLPNAEFDRSVAPIGREWERWTRVEALAEDRALLDEALDADRERRDAPIWDRGGAGARRLDAVARTLRARA